MPKDLNASEFQKDSIENSFDLCFLMQFLNSKYTIVTQRIAEARIIFLLENLFKL